MLAASSTAPPRCSTSCSPPPLLVFLALGVKLNSRGPVFFKHERIGQSEKPFHFYKFRSMVTNADKSELDLHEQNESNDVQFTMKRDPRVIRIGAVMRRYSLDGLPQLFNVLGGSMLLVGPRPSPARSSSTASTCAVGCS